MAKANLILANGTKVNLEGTAEEVKDLLEHFSGEKQVSPKRKTTKTKRKQSSNSAKKQTKKQGGPTGLIVELAEEDYFKSKRTISDIQKKLEERGHIYAITSISSPLTRLTRKREI